jgi:hypothetical protein
MAKRGFLDPPSTGSTVCMSISIAAIVIAFADAFSGNGELFVILFLFVMPGALFVAVVISLTEGELPPPTGPSGKCVMCGYSLEGLPSPRCPECGHENVSVE